MQNLHLLEFLAEAFWCHDHHFQCLAVPVELENGVYATKKLLLETQVNEDLE